MKELAIKEIEEVSGADGYGYQVGTVMALGAVAIATAPLAAGAGALVATAWAAGLILSWGSSAAYQMNTLN